MTLDSHVLRACIIHVRSPDNTYHVLLPTLNLSKSLLKFALKIAKVKSRESCRKIKRKEWKKVFKTKYEATVREKPFDPAII